MSHISKQDLKHDAVKDTLLKLVEFTVLHKERVIAGTIAVFVILFAIVWYQSSSNKKMEEGDVVLTNANAAFFSGQYDTAIASYNNIIENYAGTPAADKSYFFLATAYYYSQKYDDAEKFFKEYIKRGKDPFFKTSAMMGLGAIKEQKGDFKGAIEEYQKTVQKYPQSALAPYIYVSIGRCYEHLNDAKKAMESYQYVKEHYPESEISGESEFYRKLLKGRAEALGMN